ncbi:hypothetical protein ACET3Z_021557 [Daucus carota]
MLKHSSLYGCCVSKGNWIAGSAIVAKVYVSLEPPCWTVDADKLMKSFTSRTKAIVLNSSIWILPPLEKELEGSSRCSGSSFMNDNTSNSVNKHQTRWAGFTEARGDYPFSHHKLIIQFHEASAAQDQKLEELVHKAILELLRPNPTE